MNNLPLILKRSITVARVDGIITADMVVEICVIEVNTIPVLIEILHVALYVLSIGPPDGEHADQRPRRLALDRLIARFQSGPGYGQQVDPRAIIIDDLLDGRKVIVELFIADLEAIDHAVSILPIVALRYRGRIRCHLIGAWQQRFSAAGLALRPFGSILQWEV